MKQVSAMIVHSKMGENSLTFFFSILNTVVEAIKVYRKHRMLHREFMLCDEDEIAAIARDLGLNSGELIRLVTDKTKPTTALDELLANIGIKTENLALEEPAIIRELQRICLTCGRKQECKYHLTHGTLTKCYRDFCPNTYTLDDLVASK